MIPFGLKLKHKKFRIGLLSTEFPSPSPSPSQFCFFVDDANCDERLATIYPFPSQVKTAAGNGEGDGDDDEAYDKPKNSCATICGSNFDLVTNYRFLLRIRFGNGQKDFLYDIDDDGLPRERELGHYLTMRPCPMTQAQSSGKVHIYDLQSFSLTPRTYDFPDADAPYMFVLITPKTYAHGDGVFDLETRQRFFSLPLHSRVCPYDNDVFILESRTCGKHEIEIRSTTDGRLHTSFSPRSEVHYNDELGLLCGHRGKTKKLICKGGFYSFIEYEHKSHMHKDKELLIGSRDPIYDEALFEKLFAHLVLPIVLTNLVWNYVYSIVF
jgi:hypothetical protein